MRKTIFANDNYYHIYNRGVDKRDIFCDEKDFGRFIISMRKFNVVEPIGSIYEEYLKRKREAGGKPEIPMYRRAGGSPTSNLEVGLPPAKSSQQPLVEFICYCLNKNHYHLILRQLVENGITKFMQRLGTGYTKYFNYKYSRVGPLLQGKYKAKHINSTAYFLWLSAYVNGNVEIHKLAKAKNYQYSSYQDYIGLRNDTLCNKQPVMIEFGNDVYEYEESVKIAIRDSREKKEAVKEYLENLE